MIPQRQERLPEPRRRRPAEVLAPYRPTRPAIVSEFQTDAIEVEERTPPRLARLTIYCVVALIVAAVAWAAVSSVDQVAVARGKLITTEPNVMIRPFQNSIIRSMSVQVGDIVKAGQELAVLDPTFTQSDVEQLRNKVAVANALVQRLDAELGSGEFKVPEKADPEMVLQARLLRERKSLNDSKLRNFDEIIANAQATLTKSQAEEKLLLQRLEVIGEIESMRMQLLQNQTGSKLSFLQSKDARLDIESSLTRLRGTQVEARHEIEKALAQKQAFLDEFRSTAMQSYIEARETRNGAAEELKKAELRRNLVVLTAPSDAVVLEVVQRSVGSVVKEAEPLFVLVPLDVPLEAEVLVDPEGCRLCRARAGRADQVRHLPVPEARHGAGHRPADQPRRLPEDGPRGGAPDRRGPVLQGAPDALRSAAARPPEGFQAHPRHGPSGRDPHRQAQRAVVLPLPDPARPRRGHPRALTGRGKRLRPHPRRAHSASSAQAQRFRGAETQRGREDDPRAPLCIEHAQHLRFSRARRRVACAWLTKSQVMGFRRRPSEHRASSRRDTGEMLLVPQANACLPIRLSEHRPCHAEAVHTRPP